jgi:hypothetical protein
MKNENTENISQIQLPIGCEEEISMPKRKIWRSEAAIHFNLGVDAIDARWDRDDPELLIWVKKWFDKYKKTKLEAIKLSRILKDS